MMPGETRPAKPVGTWESDFRYFDTSGIVEIYLFDKAIIAGNPWDSVVKKYLILKRFDLSLNSLNKRNWKIQYP
jgi:hypothetical protein